jgi:hypothetical protein
MQRILVEDRDGVKPTVARIRILSVPKGFSIRNTTDEKDENKKEFGNELESSDEDP